ncbi:GNAT family N-acetyltransferase [Ignatzschineria rhizosphaerae]|uniref:GNAT family N-acetyltransferase n=1 Tax=Ignatzschineria rhizosphaerae TaxID=2923279 RepID=A0ABY3X9N8_9GAMM|nr:GNAT family N-acetyltransferase [Ignatzschineria rhizosphaerae]UNM96693.1 GNAT family N-acetyltransferase [Ignatzschineria rhizosphaerae]
MLYQLAKHRILETERLVLRPITLEDAEDLFEYASDLENTIHTFPTHQSIEETNWVIANLFMAAPLGNFAIELKENGKMIGTCDLRINEGEKSAELAYAINKKYWGNGYAPEAAKKLLDLAFKDLKIERLWAKFSAANPASGRVMEKIGMTKEGVIRHSKNLRGDFVDQVVYSRIE